MSDVHPVRLVSNFSSEFRRFWSPQAVQQLEFEKWRDAELYEDIKASRKRRKREQTGGWIEKKSELWTSPWS